MKINLGRIGFDAGRYNVIGCEWDGSKERQPSVKNYSEFKEWADHVFADVVAQTGRSFLYLFELPDDPRRTEAWLYEPGEKPRLVKALRNPSNKALAEAIASLPPAKWEDAE